MRYNMVALLLLCAAAPFAAAAVAKRAIDPAAAEAAKLEYAKTSAGNDTMPFTRMVDIPADKRPQVEADKMVCATHISKEEMTRAEAAFAQRDTAKSSNVSIAASPAIPVYWHVVAAGYETWQGWLADWQIQAQIDKLNHDFASNPTGLTFYWAGLTRTINANWFHDAHYSNTYEYDLKVLLKRGTGPNALDIYSVGFTKNNTTFGYSSFPHQYTERPTFDGIMLHYATVPGGSIADRNQGKTCTHEAGHWSGLYHTFESWGTGDGCTGRGDEVSDTPAEKGPAGGCPWGKDSCESEPGLDPINNFMDYTSDSCATYFTWFQAERIRQQMSWYRGIVY